MPQKIPTSPTTVPSEVPLKNSSPSSLDMSDLTLIDTSDEVAGILSGASIESSSGVDYMLSDFVTLKDGGVFIDLDRLLNQEAFYIFLDNIFQSKHYFCDINYINITNILYNFESTTKPLREEAKKTGEFPEIQIASSIRKFHEDRLDLYKEPRISKDGKSADYFFSPWTEEEMQDIPKINIDEFIAAMWHYKIRFGLDIRVIQQAIAENKAIRTTIATEKEPISGTDAIIEPAISFEIKRGAKESTQAKVDIHVYEQSYIRVGADVPLYRKKPREDGVPGWNIHGDRINPKKPLDLPIDTFLGIGVHKATIDGIECLVSNYSGFPRIEEREIVEKGRQIKQLLKIHVDEVKVFEEGISRFTGNINADNDFRSAKTITFDVVGKNIFADKDVEANIQASENIMINGGIFGKIRGNILSGKHQRTSIIEKGRVVSNAGNIAIQESINSAYLEAKQGTILCAHASNSTLIGKRVEINQDAFNCTIIAEEVTIHGKMIGCRIISSKSISIQESSMKGNFENILSLFSPDLSNSIDIKEKSLKVEQERVTQMEHELDTSIITSVPNITKIISDKQKRLGMISIFMIILENPKELLEERNKPYVELFNKLKRVLEDTVGHWKKLKKHRTIRDQISQEITSELSILESSEQGLYIEIQDIQGPTYIQRIKFLGNKGLLELTTDETDDIAKLLAGRDTSKICILEKIPTPSAGALRWKAI